MRVITEELIENYRKELVEEEKSENTVKKYIRDIRFLMLWLDGNCVNKETVLDYKKELCEKQAPASVNSAIAALNGFFYYAGWQDIRIKPLKIQRKIFLSKEKELTKDEYDRLLNAAKTKKDHRLYYLMQTICSTGIRISELRYITADAVEKEQAYINCKGKIRVVMLPRKLCKILKKYIQKNRIRSGPIFINRNGNPLDRSYVWRMLKGLCTAASVLKSKVFPHNFRHLFARTYYSIQKDIVRLADILGHSSINTTRIYTVETGEIHREQIQKLGLLRC